MKKISVLQICKLYYPWIGGIETIVKQISENIKDEFDVSVIACQPKGRAADEIINDVSIKKCGSMGIFFSMPVSLSFIGQVRKSAQNSDILHLHVPFPLGDLAVLLSSYKGKVVVWWHSDIINQKKLLLLYKPIMNRLLKRADLIMVATQGNIDGSPYIKSFEEKCCVIPFGLNISHYLSHKMKPVLTEKLNDKKSIKFLFVGRLVYYKGIDVLLKAFAKTSNCELFVVGDGILKDECLSFINNNALSEKVHMLGKLSYDDLLSAFQDCDVFVFPSVAKSEAFGIVQLEAMVYGKPVINTWLETGVPCVSLNEQTGITVKAGDIVELTKAMQMLTDNGELRVEYGKKAALRVKEHFDEKSMINEVKKQYYNLCE